MPGGSGQPMPGLRGRAARSLVTAPLDIPVAAAMRSWLKPASNLRRRTSLILRMALRWQASRVSGKNRRG